MGPLRILVRRPLVHRDLHSSAFWGQVERGARAADAAATLCRRLCALRPQIEKIVGRFATTDNARAELLQGVLIRAHAKWGSVPGDRRSDGWLLRVAVTSCIDAARKDARRRRHEC